VVGKRQPIVANRVVYNLVGVVFVTSFVVCVVLFGVQTSPPSPVRVVPIPTVVSAETVREASALPEYPGAIPVLTYHDIYDPVSQSRFTDNMRTLRAAGFQTVRLADLHRVLKGDTTNLPPKPILVTFDDGALSNWTIADPVLQEVNFNAVAFLLTSHLHLDRKPSYYLSESNVTSMQRSGRWEFGSHTHDLHRTVRSTHGFGSELTNRMVIDGVEETQEQWRTRVRTDLSTSQAIYRRVLGHPVTAFSFPFGEDGIDTPAAADLPNILHETGIDAAFIEGDHGILSSAGPWSPKYRLTRIRADSTPSEDLVKLLRKAMPVPPARDLAVLPWRAENGTCTASGPASLVVASSGYGTCLIGGANTSRWVDYAVRVRVVGANRNASGVITLRDSTGTRYRGRLELVIGESQAVLRERAVDGSRSVLAATRVTASTAHVVEIRVQGQTAAVTIDGAPAIAAPLNSDVGAGGVQFAIAASGPREIRYEAPTFTDLVVGAPTGR
jgi:peptidoglycan/xylan/chitin deacetylase (PgdA/CDA1 family)